jgi:hypothetical protein
MGLFMPDSQRSLSNSSGQALLITICIGLVLVIAMTVVVFVNQTGTLHHTATAQRGRGRSVAEEGISYAIQELSVSTATWQNALNGVFTNTDCNTGNDVLSPSGSHFQLYCSTGTTNNPNLQIYQVAVEAMTFMPGSGKATPARAMKAYLSQRTLGADLATGYHAAAALELVSKPNILGTLNVHWGPIICLDSFNTGAWDLPDVIDSERYPRKFSAGGLTCNPLGACAYSRSPNSAGSDQKEYWAFAPLNAPPPINESYYQTLAQNTVVPNPPYSLQTFLQNGTYVNIPANCPTVASCGYFVVPPGDTAVFGNGFTLSGGVTNAAIYVNGSTEFDKIAIDSAAFVINGAVTVTDTSGGNQPDLHVPYTAPLEYPYLSAGTPASMPCPGPVEPAPGDTLANGLPKYDCPSTSVFPGNVQFRGFLWAKGLMKVKTAGWTMVGALMVGDMSQPPGAGGQLEILAGNSLNLAYDDGIGRQVVQASNTSIRVEPDMIQNVSTF